MTEYLIILGIVAIAAIAIVGLFGQQIKQVFYRSTSTLGGSDAGGGSSSQITSSADTAANTTENMNTFDKDKNSNPPPPPPAPAPVATGWGGAPSYWFYGALAALAAARKLSARPRIPDEHDCASPPG
jgi:Flp pilus assembly pilin Flp